MTMMKKFLSIEKEDELRKEYDFLVSHGETKSASFDRWMRYVNHYRFDEIENRYFYIEEV